jgi:hypothetical protein
MKVMGIGLKGGTSFMLKLRTMANQMDSKSVALKVLTVLYSLKKAYNGFSFFLFNGLAINTSP